jgi:hypothetical protein
MPSSELTNWQAIFSNEDEDAKEREKEAKNNTGKAKTRRR